MSEEESKFEDELEQVYWIYDSNVKKKNYTDRDCFKMAVRTLVKRLNLNRW